jgi:hypothetical protein
MQIKISIPHADKPQNTEVIEDRRDLILTHQEALAGSPDDMAACVRKISEPA